VVCAKTDKPIEIPFGGLNCLGPRNHELDGGQGRMNSFATTMGDKSAMRPFVKIF